MTPRKLLLVFTAAWLPVAGLAQHNEGPAALQIRAVLHDPLHPVAELYLADRTGSVVRLELVAEGWSKPQFTVPINGSLVLYDNATVDPKKPGANVAASCKIPANTQRAMIVVVPGPADAKPAYRLVLVDDSAKAFPKGESRVISLVAVEMAIEAGEHKLPVHPGKITDVPAVKRVNEFNMAQANFYYKDQQSWVAFTERQLQFLDAFRRVFIIHATPGAIQPAVTTIVDTAPARPLN